MKKTVLFISMLLIFSHIKAADFVVENFENKSIGTTLNMKAWNSEDGSATVVADPTDASNKVVNIVTSNYDALLQLNVSLPSGAKLSDYESFTFDIYIPDHSEDEHPNYKNMNIYIDGEKKYEDDDYPEQAKLATWTTKTYTIASLGLTAEEANKNSFTIAFGISTDKGNYFIDNVKFTGGNNGQPPVENGVFVIDNFEEKSIGTTFDMRAWNPEDGTATVAADPVDASNKVVNIVTSNWDAFLQLNVNLPSGTKLSDYEDFTFDIYIPSNTEDEHPNYKNMNIYVDGEKKYEDEGYPEQAKITTWTTKTYTIESLGLTAEEAAKNSFAIAFGISTENGNYFIDNVELIKKATGVKHTILLDNKPYIVGNTLYLHGVNAEKIDVYSISGALVGGGVNLSSLDVSNLNTGIYIVKAEIGGKVLISKVIKK